MTCTKAGPAESAWNELDATLQWRVTRLKALWAFLDECRKEGMTLPRVELDECSASWSYTSRARFDRDGFHGEHQQQDYRCANPYVDSESWDACRQEFIASLKQRWSAEAGKE